MSDTISLEWIGARLRAIQAEQRTLLTQYELTRTMLSEVLRLLSERIGNFEALSEARIERVETRLDGIETRMGGIETRMDGIETRMDGIETRMDGIETRMGGIETRMGGIETRMDGMGAQLDRIEGLLRPSS
jgi:chromosome segregation ATPase